MKTYIQKIMMCIGLAVVFLSTALLVSAYEDGAYLVTTTTTYEDPRTGETADGGTQVALGNSMAQSIVESQALVEYDQGVSYMTIGLGLASNISNVRVLVNDQQVSASISGTSTNNGDTVNHYCFQAEPGTLVSFILYVTPMGRDVQFFVQTGTTLTAGTGIYYSAVQERLNQEAAQTTTEQNTATQTEETSQSQETEEEDSTIDESAEEEEEEDTSTDEETKEVVNVSVEDLFDGVTGLSKHIVSTNTSSSSKVLLWSMLGIGSVAIIGVGGYFGYKKWKEKVERKEVI